jgi:hypothetical protein
MGRNILARSMLLIVLSLMLLFLGGCGGYSSVSVGVNDYWGPYHGYGPNINYHYDYHPQRHHHHNTAIGRPHHRPPHGAHHRPRPPRHSHR